MRTAFRAVGRSITERNASLIDALVIYAAAQQGFGLYESLVFIAGWTYTSLFLTAYFEKKGGTA